MFTRATLTTSLLLSLSSVTGCSSPPPPSDPRITDYDGSQLFQSYCARCHGASGKGDGVVAVTILEYGAPDLTQIADRAGGMFPREDVKKIIAGTSKLPHHKRRDMPVWARKFYNSKTKTPAAEKARTDALIERLVDHVASLQRTPEAARHE